VWAFIAVSTNKKPVSEVADCAVNNAEAVVPVAKLNNRLGVKSIWKAPGGAAIMKTVGEDILSVLNWRIFWRSEDLQFLVISEF